MLLDDVVKPECAQRLQHEWQTGACGDLFLAAGRIEFKPEDSLMRSTAARCAKCHVL